jgi:hypothetical protein
MRKGIITTLFMFLSCVGGGEAPTSGDTRSPRTATPSTAAAPAECTRDSDCVPASCCHSTWCTPVAEAPACSGVGCQAVSLPQTLDGAAIEGIGCLCVEGRCGARLNDGCVVVGPQAPAQEASELDPPRTCPPTRRSHEVRRGG